MTAPDRLTNNQIAELVGVSPAQARRFWRALGLPDAGDAAGYTTRDLEALTVLYRSLEVAGLDLDTGISVARAVGQSVARMADWQVAAIASGSEKALMAGTREDRSEQQFRLAEQLIPAMEEVVLHAWHRHLDAAISRLNPDPSEDVGETFDATVGFADLVGFSKLSNELDSHRLGELVEIFESRCADAVASHDGRMIKTIGDSVLFLADGADRADRCMDIAGSLIKLIGGDQRLPDISVGLATGEVVARMGDVFGPPVNLAARLTALARRNRVLVDPQTVEGLTPGRYELLRLSPRPLRGFGMVEPVAVRLA